MWHYLRAGRYIRTLWTRNGRYQVRLLFCRSRRARRCSMVVDEGSFFVLLARWLNPNPTGSHDNPVWSRVDSHDGNLIVVKVTSATYLPSSSKSRSLGVKIQGRCVVSKPSNSRPRRRQHPSSEPQASDEDSSSLPAAVLPSRCLSSHTLTSS